MSSRGITFLSIYEKVLKYRNKKVHSIDLQITNLVCLYMIQVSNESKIYKVHACKTLVNSRPLPRLWRYDDHVES